MKKKLALLLSAVMVVGMIPMTAFAVTTNEISKVVTGTDGSKYTTTSTASTLTIKDKNLNDVTGTSTFKMTLTNAEWKIPTTTGGTTFLGVGAVAQDYTDATLNGTDGTDIQVQLLSATQAIVTATTTAAVSPAINKLVLPMYTELKGEGDATVTIDAMESVITSGTFKFGNVVSGATTTTIEKKVDVTQSGAEIKPIVVTETAAGSMEDGIIKLRLSNGFTFDTSKAPRLASYPSATFAVANTAQAGVTVNANGFTSDGEELYINVAFAGGESSSATTFSISNIFVMYDEDDVEVGDVADVTVSGAGMTKATLEVGTAVSYGVAFTVENKTLPTVYSGRADNDEDTLKVTFKENVAGSWLSGRKTTITFPKGVEVLGITETPKSGYTGSLVSKVEDNVVTFTTSPTTTSGTIKGEFKFQLSVSPEFTGEITATLGGAGVEEDMAVAVATAEAPVTFEVDSNEVSIDYRNVSIGDIIIKEAFTGALQKGKTLALQIEDDYISFDGTPKVEVVEGDIKIEDVTVTSGKLVIEIKTASAKTPAVLKVTGNELYLGRNIPAGKFALELVKNGADAEVTGTTISDDIIAGSAKVTPVTGVFDTFFQNSNKTTYKKTPVFDVNKLTIADDFINVVTAGRDQDDSTFTTQISVTIGADKLVAGKTDIALDVPAYISEGYTMLPVRAVTEALSGKAIVRWDDATKTVTITFGSRVISMTVGSKTMNINGVAVQMSKACEITDSRAFIPLRDLGYALGLNDSKINWDDATKTATLN